MKNQVLTSQQLPELDINVRVDTEAFELMHRQQTFILLGTVAASTFVFLAIRTLVTTPLLGIWLLLVCLSSLARYLINRFSLNKLDINQLKIFYFSGSLISGILWGALPLIVSFTNNFLAMSISAIVVSCMASAAIAGLSPYPRAYYAYSIPAILGMGTAFLIYEEQSVALLTILSLFYLLVVVSFCNNIHRTTINAIRLRLENEALLEEVRKQVSIAEKANTDKSRFLAAASHDLRQPFHALSLFVSSINDDALDKNTKDIIGNIRSSTMVLEKMFTELLDVSRLDAGAVSPHILHFSCMDLVNSLHKEFLSIAREKDLDFVCNETDLVIHSDPLLCERILRNLLSNAFNYTESGTVQVDFEEAENKISIAVSDTGIGIARDKFDHIFSEFEQLQNPERDRNKGLGLGLAIVKRLCELLDLDIEVQSTLGQGSTFTVLLPKGEPRLTYRSDLNTQPPSQVTGLQDIKVLVIDDDVMVLEGMKMQLEKWQCEGWFAENAEQARTILSESGNPDLIICDYRLREEKTGLELMRELQDVMGNTIPSIIITGDTDPDVIKSIMKESNSLVLHKPLQSAKLRLAINSLIQ